MGDCSPDLLKLIKPLLRLVDRRMHGWCLSGGVAAVPLTVTLNRLSTRKPWL